jgi:hypothetical protein
MVVSRDPQRVKVTAPGAARLNVLRPLSEGSKRDRIVEILTYV